MKIVASAYYTLGAFSATLRGTLYGKSFQCQSPDGGVAQSGYARCSNAGGGIYYKQTVPTAFIGDIDVGYKLTKSIEISAGANNVFNKRPPNWTVLAGAFPQTVVTGGNVYDAPMTFSPYGINGGYYYGKISFNF